MKKMNKKNYVTPEIEIISLWGRGLMSNVSGISGSTDQPDIPHIGDGGDNDDDAPDPTAKWFSWDEEGEW